MHTMEVNEGMVGFHWHAEMCQINNGPWVACLSDLTVSTWFEVGLALLLVAGVEAIIRTVMFCRRNDY